MNPQTALLDIITMTVDLVGFTRDYTNNESTRTAMRSNGTEWLPTWAALTEDADTLGQACDAVTTWVAEGGDIPESHATFVKVLERAALAQKDAHEAVETLVNIFD